MATKTGLVYDQPEPGETTWAVRLRSPKDGTFQYMSQAEYWDLNSALEAVASAYDGAFREDGRHQIVRIDRTVI